MKNGDSFHWPHSTPAPLDLARRLASVREHWFALCLKGLDEFWLSHPERSPEAVNRILAGSADLALRAYQFMGAGTFIQSRHYVPMHLEDMYLDSVRSIVWGPDEPAIKDYFVRYYEADARDGPEKSSIFPLSADLARHVMNADPLIGEVFLIQEMVLLFSGLTLAETALAFGDKAEVDRIAQEIQEWESAHPPSST